MRLFYRILSTEPTCYLCHAHPSRPWLLFITADFIIFYSGWHVTPNSWLRTCLYLLRTCITRPHHNTVTENACLPWVISRHQAATWFFVITGLCFYLIWTRCLQWLVINSSSHWLCHTQHGPPPFQYALSIPNRKACGLWWLALLYC